MPTLRPTDGTTYCTVETGIFSYTYDGSTSTGACFKKDQTCLSEWYWADPVNVTKFNIRSHYYYPNSRINGIWGRVDGNWVQVWDGEWKPAHAAWDSKVISCNNCTGIRISQTHITQPSRPCITEVTVDYEEEAVTSCTASFQETSAKVGDTIHADFTWSNAVYRGFPYYHYAVMNITDPNGNVYAQYFELTDPSGSKSLSCVTDMVGTWKCQIGVWQGVFYVTCTDTVPVSEGDFILYEALTCLWVSGYADHGPLVTEFDIGTVIYAYGEIHGPDLYGKAVKHEWWYKKVGESEFTKKWEYIWNPIDGHYTGYANWTWWDIGSSYGPGEGYIKVYLDGVLLGTTNNYTVKGGAIGKIYYQSSEFYTGPFAPDAYERVMYCNLYNDNYAGQGTLFIKVCEYPNTPNENQIDYEEYPNIPPGQSLGHSTYANMPIGISEWPLGVKVWGDGETEPPWGSMGTKIFKILSG